MKNKLVFLTIKTLNGKIALNISGMHCALCASNIESALKRLPEFGFRSIKFIIDEQI